MSADKLETVYRFFENKAISLKDFDQFYVPAEKGRGALDYRRLKRHLGNDPDGSLKILFAGHKGCGKTTELIRLQKEIQQDFVVLNFSVMKELDLLNINYIELFIVTMEKLFKFAERNPRLTIKQIYLDNIKNWLVSREIIKISDKYMGLNINSEIEGGLDIPFLAKFFAKFAASAKSSSSLKEVLKKEIEPRLSDLIFHCNTLLWEIKNQLKKINKKGLVIIMEDLDKAGITNSQNIFYDHSAQLTQLNCHCIFTFPIALLYNISFNAIKSNYNKDIVLPMIKVFNRDGSDNIKGIEIMRAIVAKRMDLELFKTPDILNKMIKYSGGCLWDLFQMICDAADSALDFEREQINEDDYQSGYRALKSDYEFTIAENVEKKIPVEKYFETLQACASDPLKKPEATDILLDLRNNRTVLSYNGVNWSDVHPVVKEILKEKGLI